MRLPKGLSLIETDKQILSKLYDTLIVQYDKDSKHLTLRTGGWKTRHTLKCINLVLNDLIPNELKVKTYKGNWTLFQNDTPTITFTENLVVLI